MLSEKIKNVIILFCRAGYSGAESSICPMFAKVFPPGGDLPKWRCTFGAVWLLTSWEFGVTINHQLKKDNKNMDGSTAIQAQVSALNTANTTQAAVANSVVQNAAANAPSSGDLASPSSQTPAKTPTSGQNLAAYA